MQRNRGFVSSRVSQWTGFLPVVRLLPTIPFLAIGGTQYTDATHIYHAFPSSGTFQVVSGQKNVDVLVIAGGGSGSVDRAGAGGAGGVLAFLNQLMTPGEYLAVVGGGAAGTTGGQAFRGINSSFSNLTPSIGGGGGGGGGGDILTNGLSGGSGGGAGNNPPGGFSTGGAGTPGQGFAGGNSVYQAPNYGGGGGGGAGGAGANGTASVGGNGGPGTSAYSSWGIATGYGQLVSSVRWFAGGGGGGNYGSSGGPHGTGGIGGGGAGTWSGTGNSGLINTGSGGGSNGSSGTGGSGGSGLVIVRYLQSP